MDRVSMARHYDTVRTRWEGDICYLQMYRPDANNTINDTLVEECGAVLRECEASAKIVVLEGLPEVFCFGADLQTLSEARVRESHQHNAEALYALWLRFKRGPFISIAHVRGKVNAGGVGFAAACDLVLCEEKATFSLSELLFGLVPACVLPFLVERIGSARANAMTLMTQPVPGKQAQAWGLADACSENSENLLRIHLLRLRLLPKEGIARYKLYMGSLNNSVDASLPMAVACNAEVFSDEKNLAKIDRYLVTGKFPWEAEHA